MSARPALNQATMSQPGAIQPTVPHRRIAPNSLSGFCKWLKQTAVPRKKIGPVSIQYSSVTPKTA